MQQLILDVKPQKNKYLAEDFLPLSNSFEAHRILLASISNDMPGALILGDSGTGKTYLLNILNQYFNNKDEVVFVDNINNLPNVNSNIKYLLVDNISSLTLEQQEQLFHWYNHLKDCKGKMFLVFSDTIDNVVSLLDLRSRLLTLNQAITQYPTDKDVEIFILKQVFDRQITLNEDVLKYMILRAERSFNKIEDVLDKIDDESLRKQRKITIPFVKEFLD